MVFNLRSWSIYSHLNVLLSYRIACRNTSGRIVALGIVLVSILLITVVVDVEVVEVEVEEKLVEVETLVL